MAVGARHLDARSPEATVFDAVRGSFEFAFNLKEAGALTVGRTTRYPVDWGKPLAAAELACERE